MEGASEPVEAGTCLHRLRRCVEAPERRLARPVAVVPSGGKSLAAGGSCGDMKNLTRSFPGRG
ncbi:hypothetical protein JCM9533A_16170 [Catenuloplanes niger JCM 9533]